MIFFSSNSSIILKEMDIATIIGKESAVTLEHTNAHAVRSRLTLNYSKERAFRNGLVHELPH